MMKTSIVRRMGLAAALAVALGGQGLAQSSGQIKVEGVFHDFTAALDALGPWQIVGEWSLTYHTVSGKVDLAAILSMVRADNASRQAHTHHLTMTDGVIEAISNGYRITGTAAITGNGSPAGFTGSPIVFEITGGSAVSPSNVKLTFQAPATGHFGDQPLDGVVRFAK